MRTQTQIARPLPRRGEPVLVKRRFEWVAAVVTATGTSNGRRAFWTNAGRSVLLLRSGEGRTWLRQGGSVRR